MRVSETRTPAKAVRGVFEMRTIPQASVAVDLRPLRAEHPLANGVFAALRCPRFVTGGT